MHQRPLLRWLIRSGLCALSLAQAQQPAARPELIRNLNDELQRAATPARVRALATSRAALLAQSIDSDPAGALRLALSDETLAALRRIAPDAELEERGEWSGEAEVVIADDFAAGSSRTRVSLRSGGRLLDLRFAGPRPEFTTGAELRVRGLRLGSTVAVGESLAQPRLAGACGPTGAHRVAVLLVNFPGSSLPAGVNAQSIAAALSGGAHSLDGYWREASYGAISATGDVFGPLSLGVDYGAGQYNEIRDAAINAAASPSLRNYNHIVIVMPPGFPTAGGLGTLGCANLNYASTGSFQAGVVWIRSDMFQPADVGVCALVHENGHNLGLNHASSESFGSVPLGPAAQTPVHDEYGDRFSLMGLCYTFNGTTLLGHYAAQHKVALGWMVATNYRTVTAAGAYTLQPIEYATGGVQALRIQRPGSNQWLWLEYRQPTGYDATFAGFSSQVYSGAVIHFEDASDTTYTGYTRLLNFSAAARPGDFTMPALPAGAHWQDPSSALTIDVAAPTPSALNVTIGYGSAPPPPPPPACSYNLSPGAASAPFSGVSGSFSVTTTAGCAWTPVANASWLTITSGGPGSGSGSVQFAAAANSGPLRSATIGVAGQSFTVTQAASPAVASGLRFVPVAPCRVADTRATSALGGGASRDFNPVATACGIPAAAVAYALNVTVVPIGPLGYLSIWPAGQAQPVVSTLNSGDGRVKANAALVPAGLNGAVSVYASNPAHVIIDIDGYFVAGGSGLAYYPIAPCRLQDTRSSGPALAAGSPRTIAVAGTCGIPVSAQAYALNMTVVPSMALGYLAVWPSGQGQPATSTLNAPTGGVTSNLAIVPAGAGGAIIALATNPTDLIVDAMGYFAPPGAGSLDFYATTPCRVLDTRSPAGALGGPVMGASEARAFPVPASSCSIPATAKAYSLNATVVPAVTLGFLGLWGTGPQPFVSTLNSPDATVVANAALTPAGASGAVTAYTSNQSHLILDINGYFQ